MLKCWYFTFLHIIYTDVQVCTLISFLGGVVVLTH